MIDWSANNVGFVIAGYAGAILVLAIVIAAIVRNSAKLRHTLTEMSLPDIGDDPSA